MPASGAHNELIWDWTIDGYEVINKWAFHICFSRQMVSLSNDSLSKCRPRSLDISTETVHTWRSMSASLVEKGEGRGPGGLQRKGGRWRRWYERIQQDQQDGTNLAWRAETWKKQIRFKCLNCMNQPVFSFSLSSLLKWTVLRLLSNCRVKFLQAFKRIVCNTIGIGKGLES